MNYNKIEFCKDCNQLMTINSTDNSVIFECLFCKNIKPIENGTVVYHSYKQDNTKDMALEKKTYLKNINIYPLVYKNCDSCKNITSHRKITTTENVVFYICTICSK